MATILLAACSPGAESGQSAYGDEDELPRPTEAQARAAVQDYFDKHSECTPFFDLPRDVAANDDYSLRQMRAFVDAGVLRESGVTGGAEGQFVRFTATPAGQGEIRPGTGDMADFRAVVCYGHRKVGAVQIGEPDTFTQKVSVKYRYTLADVPDWAKTPSLLTFYPVFEKWLSREAEANEDLEWADGGWKMQRQQDFGLFDFRQQAR